MKKTLLEIAENWCNKNITFDMSPKEQKRYWKIISKETEHFGDCTGDSNACLMCHYVASIKKAIRHIYKETKKQKI